MKKLLLCFMFLGFYVTTYGQSQSRSKESYEKFRISLGVNAINNTGSGSPFKEASNWAFNTPISLGFEYRLTDLLAVEELISFNKYDSSTLIDGISPTKDLSYFSADTNINYYIGDHFLNSEKIDLFISGGIGFNHIEVLNASANFGGGLFYWFSDSIGAKVQAMGKWPVYRNGDILDSRHFQYFLQLVYRF